MNFFKYFYFRLTQVLFEKNGEHKENAIALVTLSECLIIGTFLIILIHFMFNKNIMATYSKQFGYFGGAMAIVLYIFNYKLYNGTTYETLKLDWQKESNIAKILKDIFIWIFLFVPIILFVCVANYLHSH